MWFPEEPQVHVFEYQLADGLVQRRNAYSQGQTQAEEQPDAQVTSYPRFSGIRAPLKPFLPSQKESKTLWTCGPQKQPGIKTRERSPRESGASKLEKPQTPKGESVQGRNQMTPPVWQQLDLLRLDLLGWAGKRKHSGMRPVLKLEQMQHWHTKNDRTPRTTRRSKNQPCGELRTSSRTKKGGFLEGGFCKTQASLGCGALSAKLHCQAQYPGVFLFSLAATLDSTETSLLNPLFLAADLGLL